MVSNFLRDLSLFRNYFSGSVDDNLDFKFGEGAYVDTGCSATLFGQMWYFGGNVANGGNGKISYTKQVCISDKKTRFQNN